MKRFVLTFTVLIAAAVGWTTFAGADASDLPPNWHVHDCNVPDTTTEPACGFDAEGDWHLPAGFFPAILGVSGASYVDDPPECPNATDKAFLPQGRQDNQPLRAGVCMTSAKIIHLRTVPDGTSGPEGWSFRDGPEAGFDTYYLITPRETNYVQGGPPLGRPRPPASAKQSRRCPAARAASEPAEPRCRPR
jgi:hypothetical protein